MFCEGKCKEVTETLQGTLVKKCGLLRELVFDSKITGKTECIELCMIEAIMNSLHRQEQGQLRIQTATENARNETAKQMGFVSDTLKRGFVGILREAELKRLFMEETLRQENALIEESNKQLLKTVQEVD